MKAISLRHARATIAGLVVLVSTLWSPMLSAEPQPRSSGAPRDGGKISLLYFAGLPEGARIRANIDRFKRETGIDVTYQELAYDQIRARQIKSFNAVKAEFDVVFVDDIWMYEYVRKGYVKELTELVQRDGYDFEDIIPKVAAAEGLLDGKVWLIPQRADVQVLFYNKAIFNDPQVREAYKAKANRDLTVPDTWEEYALVARGLHGLIRQSQTIIGSAETLRRPHFAFEFFATRYWSITGQDFLSGDTKAIFHGPDGVAALKYLQSLRASWAPGSLNAAHDESVSAFQSGRVALLPQWFGFYAPLKDTSTGLGDRLGVAMMPGSLVDGTIRRAPSIGGGSLGIATNSKNTEAAWAFVKFVTSREYLAEAALNGEIVTRQSAYTPEVLKRNPGSDVYRASLDLSRFRPRAIAYAAIEDAIGEGVSRALAREVSPEKALEDAAKVVDQLLANPK